MKALSLTQPWATLVAVGAKRIETRSWSTAYRGPLAIHAAKGFPEDCQAICAGSPFVRGLNGRTPARLPLGAIVAMVRLVDVQRTELYDDDDAFQEADECAFGDYSPGRFAWILDDVRALPEPIQAKGSLGLWSVPSEIADRITR